MRRVLAAALVVLLGSVAQAGAEAPALLARGQSQVLLGTDQGYWGALWGEPLDATVFSRPRLRPSSAVNAYLAVQPIAHACASSAAADHRKLYSFPQFYASAQPLGEGLYQSATNAVVAAQARAPGARTCLWLAHSARTPTPAQTQVVPFVNGVLAATISSVDPAGRPFELDASYAGFPQRRYPPVQLSGTCGGTDFGETMLGNVGIPNLGDGANGTTNCSASFAFSGAGQHGTVLAYSPVLAGQLPPPVNHLGGCFSGLGGMTTAEAVYYMDAQGCTVDRLLPGPGPAVYVDGGAAQQFWSEPGNPSGGSTVIPAGTHVDIVTPAVNGLAGLPPPRVPGQATRPAPPGSECNDIATLSPSFLGREGKLVELPTLASRDMPIAVTASVSLGSVGICSRALEGSVLPTLDGASGLGLHFAYAHGQTRRERSASYSFLPFAWHVPADSGGKSPPPAEIEWSGETARGIQVSPALSFGYSPGARPEVSLDLISVPVAKETATLLSAGRPFLSATVGPELVLGLKVDRRELERVTAEAVAAGLSAASAAQYVARELRDELAVATDAELPAIDPQPIDIAGVAPEMEQVQAEVVADITAENAAEAVAATAYETAAVDNVLELPFRATENVVGDVVDTVAEDPELLLLEAAAAGRHGAVPTATSAGRRRPHLPVTPLTSTHGSLDATRPATASVLRHLSLRHLHRAPLPRSEIAAAVHSVLTTALPVRVGALGVTQTRLRGGGQLGVVAIGLGLGADHTAMLVIQGPGYRATRFLDVHAGTAAATVTLPRRLAAGRWTLAVEDLSTTTSAPGAASARMGIFAVRGR